MAVIFLEILFVVIDIDKEIIEIISFINAVFQKKAYKQEMINIKSRNVERHFLKCLSFFLNILFKDGFNENMLISSFSTVSPIENIIINNARQLTTDIRKSTFSADTIIRKKLDIMHKNQMAALFINSLPNKTN